MHLRDIAILLVIEFGIKTFFYPLIFGTVHKFRGEPPVEVELEQ